MRAPDVVASEQGSDARFIDRIAARDPEALGELYDRYGRVVFGVLYRMLGQPEIAEEVAQDAFDSVWRQVRSYRSERGTVRTWLLAITRNAAIDWRRTKGKRMERESALDGAAGLPDELPVEERVFTVLRAARVRDEVERLPVEQREVLLLAFWGGLSQSEIAVRTGAPLGTVKSRVRLAMAKLRAPLAGEVTE